MTIVIPVRAGDLNPELVFALRCLEQNYPDHGDVWTVGYQPRWLVNVNHIPGNLPHTGHWNWRVYHNILAAAEHPDVPEKFWVWNDDFFITTPMADIPILHHGSLIKQTAGIRKNPRTWWHKSLLLTLETLQRAGYPDPTSYELHCPLPVDKTGMAEALRRFADTNRNGIPPQWRTLYGVVNDIGGQQTADYKIRTRTGPINKPFHSTSDSSFRYFRGYFQTRYPRKSRYEK